MKVKLLDKLAHAPRYASKSAAGLDLCALEPVQIWSHERKVVRTGLAVELPAGHVGLVCPRSGLASRDGVTVLNAPGVIDEDYRGEVVVLLVNTSATRYDAPAGTRIAQLVVVPVQRVTVDVVGSLDETARGAGGQGSTG